MVDKYMMLSCCSICTSNNTTWYYDILGGWNDDSETLDAVMFCENCGTEHNVTLKIDSKEIA